MTDAHAPEDPPSVLVIEDDEDLAETYELWLEPEYDVTTAHSGAAGLAWYDGTVDVVLLDRRLPKLSGTRVLRAMADREVDDQRAMLTSTDPGAELVELPCNEYLTKPVDKATLRDAVRELQMRLTLDDELQRYFALTSKIAALEASDSPDAETAIETLRREADRARARIDDALADLDGRASPYHAIE